MIFLPVLYWQTLSTELNFEISRANDISRPIGTEAKKKHTAIFWICKSVLTSSGGFVHREQEAFVQGRSPEARCSQEEEQAEEEPPGAAAPLQTAPPETHCLMNPKHTHTHTLFTEINHLRTLKKRGCLWLHTGVKGKLIMLPFQYLKLHSNFNRCLQSVCMCLYCGVQFAFVAFVTVVQSSQHDSLLYSKM